MITESWIFQDYGIQKKKKKAKLVLSVFCIQHLSHTLSKDYAKCHVINYGENPLQSLGKSHQVCKTDAFP